MTTSISELPRTELPSALVYLTGIICGVLAAIAALIVLKDHGIALEAMWRDVLAAQAPQMRTAAAWWVMVGVAFLVSAVTAAALSRLPLPWHRFRLLRWIIGAIIVFALGEAGHLATESSEAGGGAQLAITLGALCAAALVSLFGAYFAIKR